MHLPAISRAALGAATLATAVACGPPRAAEPGAPAPAAPAPTRVVNEGALYVLESWGAPPGDTTIVFPGGERRVILLRHAPPDNSPFAELILPAGTTPDADAVQVELEPLPGIYGLEIRVPAGLEGGAILVFKYPVHFAAPAGARERYRGDAAFEQALVVGQLLAGGRVALLPVSRPAADNLAAVIPGVGRYIVAAPR